MVRACPHDGQNGGGADTPIPIAFGFLASQEVNDAGVGNLGLQDRECNWLPAWYLLDLFVTPFCRTSSFAMDTEIYLRFQR